MIMDPVISEVCLSIFVLGLAFGPLLLSPLSEVYGRFPVLMATNMLFLAFNTGSGFVQDVGSDTL